MKPSLKLPAQSYSLAGLIATVSAADRWVVIGLIVANFLPIVLAIVCGWNVADVVVFYWWENVVLGLVAILRIICAGGGGKEMQAAKLFCVPFFTVHYFMFCFGHAVFLKIVFFESSAIVSPLEFYQNLFSSQSDFLPLGGWIGIVGLLIAHLMSFARNYVMNGQYKKCISFIEMFRPYGRIVVLHIGIIFGGLAAAWLGSPLILVILLMILKTIFDLVSFAVVQAMGQASLESLTS